MKYEYVSMDYETTLNPLYDKNGQVIALYLKDSEKYYPNELNNPLLEELFNEVKVRYNEWPNNDQFINKIYTTFDKIKKNGQEADFLASIEGIEDKTITINDCVKSFLSFSIPYKNITDLGHFLVYDNHEGFIWIIDNPHLIEQLKERDYKVGVYIISKYKI